MINQTRFKSTFNWIMPVIASGVLFSCQTTQNSGKETSAAPVSTITYPAITYYTPEKAASIKSEYRKFETAFNAQYDLVEYDTLLSIVRTLKGSKKTANIINPNPEKRKVYTMEELSEGIKIFLDKWGRIVNATGAEVTFEKMEERDDFYDVTLHKNFPKERPFVNSEFNTIRIIISSTGELGFLSSNCVPSLPMPQIEWMDPEKGRNLLVDHKIMYQKFNKNNLYIVKNIDLVSAGTQSAIILVKRRENSGEKEVRAYNSELRYHYAWMYYLTLGADSKPVFRVYVDATTGEILESYYLGAE